MLELAFEPCWECYAAINIDVCFCCVRGDEMEKAAMGQCASPSKTNRFLELKVQC